MISSSNGLHRLRLYYWKEVSMRERAFLLAVLFAFGLGCTHAQELSEPEKNFEYLWKTFDRNYAIFGPKKVDWKALYRVYRPKVKPQTTDDELFEIMSSMLGHLNDNHVRLTSEKPFRVFFAGILNELMREKNFKSANEARQFLNKRPVPEKYIKSELMERMNGVFAFGWVDEGIGYFHFKGFGNIPESTAVIDEILRTFQDAKGIIVDVRKNSGGDDRVGKLIADRFADQKRLYMITYTRNGPNYDDFTPPKYWYVEPDGPQRFTKPVVLLTNRLSISAAENFALAMRVLPHVTVVGDLTSGVFADVYGDTLPNGWGFGVSYKLFVDYSGFCWEGIGVPPDLRIINTDDDIQQEKDRVLEFAIEFLNSGPLALQEEPGSLKNIRESLAKSLRVDIAENGIGAAVAGFHQAKSRGPETYYVDAEEMDALGDDLFGEGKSEEALAVFKLNAEEHPDLWWVYQKLGKIYAALGMIQSSSENYGEARRRNPKSYPWEKEADYAIQLEQTLFTEGSAALKDMFERLRNAHPDFAQYAERILNNIGYELLGMKKNEDAIAVFRINVEAFPESWNVYDSLGEAYMINGDRELAIENYEKSIGLNPDNTNGKNMLQKLREK